MKLTLIALTHEERELLMGLLTEEIEHRAVDRERFNALVQLRAYIGGHHPPPGRDPVA